MLNIRSGHLYFLTLAILAYFVLKNWEYLGEIYKTIGKFDDSLKKASKIIKPSEEKLYEGPLQLFGSGFCMKKPAADAKSGLCGEDAYLIAIPDDPTARSIIGIMKTIS